jgi:ABC-type transport system substrate-binding protein
MKRASILVLSVLLLFGAALTLHAAGEQEQTGTSGTETEGEPRRGGTLVYGLSTDPSSLDPHVHSGVAAQAVRLQVYNGLVTYYKGTEIIPELATSWETPSNTRWVFELREGVEFHNGNSFTAEDVKYSFERILDEDLGATLRSQLQDIEEINVLNSHRVEFVLSQPNAAFLSTLALSEAAIVDKQWMENGGNLKNDMMGTGPFTFEERVQGEEIVVERNPNFFKEDLPYLDSIRFVPYSDDNSRITAIRSEEIDLATYIPWASMSQIEQNPDLQLKSGKGPFMYLMFNVSSEPFDNPKVRRALGYAINRQQIIDSAFFGRGEPLYGAPTYEDAWFHHEELADYFEYDPEKAREMLAEAGYPDGFSTSITGTSTYGMLQNTTQVIQQNLEEVGLDVEIKLFDWATTVDRWQSGNYDMISFGTVPDPMDPDFYSKFFASGNSHYAEPTGYSDQKVDRLLRQGRRTLDREERSEIYLEFERHLLETSPWLFLTWREQGEAIGANIRGYEHLPGALAFMSPITLREAWIAE